MNISVQKVECISFLNDCILRPFAEFKYKIVDHFRLQFQLPRNYYH